MKNESKNIIWSVLCTILVLFTLDYFFPKDKKTADVAKAPAAIEQAIDTKNDVFVSSLDTNSQAVIEIKSDTLSGQIGLQGAVLQHLTFSKYKESVKKDSPDVDFLNNSYFTAPSFGASKGVQTPDEKTVWTADKTLLTPTEPVTLTWKNDAGVVFVRQIALDNEYMFTLTDSVQAAAEPVSVSFAGKIVRVNPKMDTAVSVHQGFVGVLDGKLKEEKYASIESDKKESYSSTGGWMGLGDKYWLAAFAFNPALAGIQSQVDFVQNGENKVFTASYQTLAQTAEPNKTVENVTYFFAGPKEFDLLTAYQDTLGIDRFELAIDFGWYYFLTKPFLRLLSWIYGLVGNMGIAILIFATLLRILLLPIAGKSFESMAKMRKIQPRVAELQKRYKDDKLRLNQEMLALYKKEKVNPASGCLPMFIQIPVFFSLYKVLSVSIEMRQAPFFGWIQDLSARDPSSVFTLFGLVPWPIPSFLNIGIWPVLMGITMYLQQKMTPQTTPSGGQGADMAAAMRWMPVIFTFMMGNFASGLVIYWTWSNVLGIIQQRYVMHKYGADK